MEAYKRVENVPYLSYRFETSKVVEYGDDDCVCFEGNLLCHLMVYAIHAFY